MARKRTKDLVIDAEVVSKVERVVSGPQAGFGFVSEAQTQTAAAPESAPGKSKRRKARKKRMDELVAGPLRILMPEPRLRCPVCQAPASPSRQIQMGPVYAYLCSDCGDVASGAMQVVNFFKMLK